MAEEKQVSGKYGYGDPYSRNLARFFKEVVIANPRQAQLLSEYTDYPDLRGVIKLETDKNGDVLRFDVPDEVAYKQKKQMLLLAY